MRWTLKGFLPVIALPGVLLLGACASTPPAYVSPPLDRRDLLVDHVEDHLGAGRAGAALDRLSFGLDRGLLEPEWVAGVLERIADKFREQYRRGMRDRDYDAVLQSRWNLEQLLPDPLQAGFSGDSGELNGLLTRDEILLEWAGYDLDRGEPILAMYRMLRRSTLADLERETAQEFFGLARKYNNDELALRLSRVLERSQENNEEYPTLIARDERTPSEMLAGTVTVWVNRGIRISDGVGVPDRVIGSGFFVDPRGYLLTNYHVISSEVDPRYNGYSRLYIRLPGRPNERVPARVVGYDRVFDLALVKVEVDAPYVFSLSDTRRLSPGERVLALGSPGGLDSTITAGIVSASGRRFLQMGEAVQIDAPVNPGNSGGALILPDGLVAGIVFAGIPQFEGVNFAIPSYWVRHFFPRLFTGGEVVHPWLGAAFHAGREGLRVVYVHPGSPAYRAGVAEGHILRSINERNVTDLAEAQDLVLERRPGDILVTEWDKSSVERGVVRTITVAERPFSPVEDALKTRSIEHLFPVLFGMEVDEISGPPWGPDFVITSVLPGSIADESSLSPNDPFTLRNWRVDTDLRAAFIQIIIRKRKAGFIESGVQLGAFLETDTFL